MQSKFIKLLEKYERHISSLTLVCGFLFDSITLRRIDVWLDNAILITHLCVVIGGIIFINLYDSGIVRVRKFHHARSLAPIPMQFSFGGLFSIFTVFYFRSASVAASWVFLLFLFFMLIGNEFFRSRYTRFNFQISVLFIAIFSYSVFALPILVGKMGALIFLQSGLASLIIIWALIGALAIFMPRRIKESLRTLAISIGGIYIAMNVFYFLNIIPPIPLSLKEFGVYHTIERGHDGSYMLVREPVSFIAQFFGRETIHIMSGEPVYFFSSVFAPTRLNTEIVHRWEYYDPKKESWITSSRIKFSVFGGRDGGYRGHSLKTSVSAGLWRVSVETPRGQVLGRKQFTVENVKTPTALETVIQ